MAKYFEQIKIDFSGELLETRLEFLNIFFKKLISDDALLENYVRRAYQSLEKTNGVLLPHSIGREMLCLFWEEHGWDRNQIDLKLLEKYSEKLFSNVLKKIAEISRREKEERIGLRFSRIPEEPERFKDFREAKITGKRLSPKKISIDQSSQPRKRYFDNQMAASGEKEFDLDQ